MDNFRPTLAKRILVPDSMQGIHGDTGLRYLGDLRIGDLNGDGQPEFIVYRSTGNGHDRGGMKPVYIAAFDFDGNEMWSNGKGGEFPSRPGPVAVADIDGDGFDEVICMFKDEQKEASPFSLADVKMQILDGRTGKVKLENAPEQLTECSGKSANWVHQRLLLADLRGSGRDCDIIVKLGTRILALDNQLDCLWTYDCKWDEYGKCPAYIPSVGDMDGDGCDEVNGGYFLLDHDGTVLWENQVGPHCDSVAIAPWDNGRMRAFASGYGHVLDEAGNVVLCLGADRVPHGQELRVARFMPGMEESQMLIRWNGHAKDVILVDTDGKVVQEFELNETPNNTGMEPLYWFGHDREALIYNGGLLWNGQGEVFAQLPDLPPVQEAFQGWWHCIPVNLYRADAEDLVLYNRWRSEVFIYAAKCRAQLPVQYCSGRRQYNVRLMD